MKKFLSLLITVSMILSVLILPIGAEESGNTLTVNGSSYTVSKSAVTAGNQTYDTVVIDGNTYLVIRTADQFKAMTGTGNYVMATDVDLGGASASDSNTYIISGWHGRLEGNGKSVTGYSIAGNNAGLFSFSDTTKDVVIQNMNFGTKSAPITGGAIGNGSNGVLCGKTNVKSLTLIRCNSYVDFSSSNAVNSAFVGQANSKNATYTFRECKTYGSIVSGNKTGAFMANIASPYVTVNFYDCINNVDVLGKSSKQGTGGFIGCANQQNTVLYFENCINAGDIYGDTTDYPVGGFIGLHTASGGTHRCTFKNCSQTGTVSGEGNYIGEFIGNTSLLNSISFSHDDVDFCYDGLFGNYPYGTKTTRGNLYFSDSVNGLQILDAAKAAYFQTAPGSGSGLTNVRVLLALPEAELVNAKNVELKVVFQNLKGTPTKKTLTVTDAEEPLTCYYSVIAGNLIAEAPIGYVMLAVVVTDVDSSWTPSGENLEVYFKVGDRVVYDNLPETDDSYDGMIVYPADNEKIFDIASAASDILERNGYKVGVISDREIEDLDAEVFKIYLGNTACELSQQATVNAGYIRYLCGEGAIAVNAANDADLAQAMNEFITDCFLKGDFTMNDSYFDKTIAANTQSLAGWQLSLPAYTHGTLDTTLYSGGYGKNPGVSSEKSTMQVIDRTTASAFAKYLTLLELNGYTKTFENAIDGNRYASYTDAQGNTFYMYYMETVAENTAEVFFNNRVHIIHDRSSNVSLDDFCYSVPASENTEFYVFNLNTTGEDTILIHAADNSWIMIDGGVTDWANNVNDPEGKFADSIYQFMREKSGLKDGEKLVISAWYLTHAHRDHFLAFGSMIDRNHEGIELQRILTNVPDTSVIYNSNNSYYVTVLNSINAYYPNVKFLKAHAGMEIQLADVHFTVLLSQDSLVEYWTTNKDEWNNHWSGWSSDKTCTKCNGEECRLGRKCYDFNNSSTVTKIRIGDMTILSTGDAYRIDRWMVPYYSMETLNVDVLKVAHHFNNHEMVATDKSGSVIDYSKYYWKLLETRADDTLYAIVTNINYAKSSAKTAWQNAFNNSADHHFIEAKYNTIYGFRSVNGEVVMTQYDAIYSYTGKIDNTAK